MEIEKKKLESEMRVRNITVCVSVAAGLSAFSGCVSSNKFDANAQALKNNPDLRRAEIHRCIIDTRRKVRERGMEGKLKYMKMGRDPIPTMCKNTVEAQASGKLTYSDYRAAQTEHLSPKALNAIRGR
ncbi:hypothetical protein [Jiella sp. M17.18]|uniref:hypothetical protein n=1 Tax=Jiella sp. M17.18 TaxID=3234247 RepID=UPI0034DE166B